MEVDPHLVVMTRCLQNPMRPLMLTTQYLFPPLNLVLNNISTATTKSVSLFFDIACYFFSKVY